MLFPPPKKPAPAVTSSTVAEAPKLIETPKEITPWQKATREVLLLFLFHSVYESESVLL